VVSKEAEMYLPQEFTQDLHNVDYDRVHQMLREKGIMNTAKILGYDVRSYDNLVLAGRMALWELKKTAPKNIEEYSSVLGHRMNTPVLSYLKANADILEEEMRKYDVRDLKHDWFSANTLIHTYLSKARYGGDPAETPQQCNMRQAVQLYHGDSVEDVLRCYREIAQGYYTHASPTIFNAGMERHQMASCFFSSVDDSIDGMDESWSMIANISKNNGGIGLDVSRIRHSEIGHVGMSSGVVPYIQVLNSIIRLVNQTGKRKGALTVYLRPWHIDIFEFCELSLKTGDHYARAHDINTAIWDCWLFQDRVRKDQEWTLFCPNYVTQLNDLWGEKFIEAYKIAEADTSIPAHAKRVVSARKLMEHIIDCQNRSSMPYLLNGDSCNAKSNHQHLGYIPCSNLCLEIIEYSSPDEIASCNIGSLSLRKYASSKTRSVNYALLGQMTRSLTRNLNRVIDNNWYPMEKIRIPNLKHRPIAIGVSGFAEMLHKLDLPFDADETKEINKKVFACMYFNSLVESINQALRSGPYESYQGSPLSKGKFQFDLWREEYETLERLGMTPPPSIRKREDDIPIDPSSWNQQPITLNNGYVVYPTWESLRQAILKFGTGNSLNISVMPTASSAQILRNCESVEAHVCNIYSRKVISGAYPVVNRYLVRDLQAIGAWNKTTVDVIQSDKGSISKLADIIQCMPEKFPDFNGDLERLHFIQRKYKTMWELSQKIFLQMAADRARYVCQSQSTNIYLDDPTPQQLAAVHTFTSYLGLKTQMYYLRTTGATEPIKFTVDRQIANYITGITVDVDDQSKKPFDSPKKNVVCTDDVCTVCQ